MKNTKFTVAIHTLVMIAKIQQQGHADISATSEIIAWSVNTNPVVIRRIVGKLRKAGLVESQPGVGGGMRLTREPETITLLDIYEALDEDEEFFPLHAHQPNPQCTVGNHIQPVLCDVYQDIKVQIRHELGKTSIATLQAEINTKIVHSG